MLGNMDAYSTKRELILAGVYKKMPDDRSRLTSHVYRYTYELTNRNKSVIHIYNGKPVTTVYYDRLGPIHDCMKTEMRICVCKQR